MNTVSRNSQLKRASLRRTCKLFFCLQFMAAQEQARRPRLVLVAPHKTTYFTWQTVADWDEFKSKAGQKLGMPSISRLLSEGGIEFDDLESLEHCVSDTKIICEGIYQVSFFPAIIPLFACLPGQLKIVFCPKLHRTQAIHQNFRLQCT
jgi:hypothetical protein